MRLEKVSLRNPGPRMYGEFSRTIEVLARKRRPVSDDSSVSPATTVYIDGQWSAADSGQEFDVFNPADGSVLGRASDAGAGETARAVEAATAAFATWSTTT